MAMERITSRKNRLVTHLRRLAGDSAYRRETRCFVCDGEKFLIEALQSGAKVEAVLWCETAEPFPVPGAESLCAPKELLEYASPLKNSPGPVFSVAMREKPPVSDTDSAIVLEGVQDPGNVGTVIRTAAALGIGRVLLTGGCADLYNPKTVRATMGAIFRQCVEETDLAGLKTLGLPLYGAALSEAAADIRTLAPDSAPCAVAIGSEGRGLSVELLTLCRGQLIIPMLPGNESLNASVAAAIAMWELRRGRL